MQNPEAAAAMMPSFAAMAEGMPGGADFFSILLMMPEQQRGEIISVIKERTAVTDSMIIEQGAIAAVRAEYKALGMDVGKIQLDYIRNTGFMMVLFTLISISANILAG